MEYNLCDDRDGRPSASESTQSEPDWFSLDDEFHHLYCPEVSASLFLGIIYVSLCCDI